ncbi:MAG: radical SAM family heme chaperone HemW [Prolixibacteraceae bacterium]|nr:radical SAM family heme chaperone HemW [Prolixibacteraceae bacterium]
MAGIYIHIPFCRQKCYYCDFYKTDKLNYLSEFLTALKKEISQQNNYLPGEFIDTIYIGGGTPSLLKEPEITSIFSSLNKYFKILPQAEITFEANPDDLDPACLAMLKRSGINRLSIGIQSFQEKHLKMMNRRHTAQQAVDSVINAKNSGFNNISVDLIYGIPGLTTDQWKDNLQKTFELPADHLSAYHLTYHEGTIFYNLLKRGKLHELSENDSFDQFTTLINKAGLAGFEQYEISNFAKNGMYSKHNTAYWTGKPYLGLGPSAHSFNGSSRKWNMSDLEKYIKLINEDEITFEEEHLTLNDKYNEFILTNLRTKWGVSLLTISEKFGKKAADYFIMTAQRFISAKSIVQKKEIYTLTPEGLFISDDIIADFMII